MSGRAIQACICNFKSQVIAFERALRSPQSEITFSKKVQYIPLEASKRIFLGRVRVLSNSTTLPNPATVKAQLVICGAPGVLSCLPLPKLTSWLDTIGMGTSMSFIAASTGDTVASCTMGSLQAKQCSDFF